MAFDDETTSVNHVACLEVQRFPVTIIKPVNHNEVAFNDPA